MKVYHDNNTYNKEELMKQGKRIFALSGGGGSGKDSIVSAILERFPGKVKKVPRITSRSIRPGEQDGVHYFFTTMEDFEEREKKDGFVATEVCVDNKYGIGWKELRRAIEEDDRLILMVGGEPCIGLKKQIPEATIIYIKVPKNELLGRMMTRGDVAEEQARAKVAETMTKEKWEAPNYDFVVWNRDNRLEEAVEEVMKIMELI